MKCAAPFVGHVLDREAERDREPPHRIVIPSVSMGKLDGASEHTYTVRNSSPSPPGFLQPIFQCIFRCGQSWGVGFAAP